MGYKTVERCGRLSARICFIRKMPSSKSKTAFSETFFFLDEIYRGDRTPNPLITSRILRGE